MNRKHLIACTITLTIAAGLTYWFFPWPAIATVKRVISIGQG
jgi:hypothetical protein